MPRELTFDFDKAIQALNYIAIKVGQDRSMNKMKAIKLLYFADRYHIRKYGRPILNDKYLAMEYGPVASTSKDIAELSVFLPQNESERAQKYISPAKDSKYYYMSVNEFDEDVFSDSEIEALNFALEKFGDKNQYSLADLSHNYPEWKKFEGDLEKGARSVGMNYIDFFENSHLPNDMFEETNEYVESSREAFEMFELVDEKW